MTTLSATTTEANPQSAANMESASNVEGSPAELGQHAGLHKFFQVVLKDPYALATLLASLMLTFIFSYALIFVVFYSLRSNTWDHTLPWAITCVVTGVLLAGVLYRLALSLTQSNNSETAPLSSAAAKSEEPLTAEDRECPVVQSTRNPKLDYLKLVVNLVVMLHHSVDVIQCEEYYAEDVNSRRLTKFVIPFLMQTMAFTSGFVYTPVENASKSSTLLQLLAGYVVLQLVYLMTLKYTVIAQNPSDGLSCFYSAAYLVLPPPPGPPPPGAPDNLPTEPSLPFWKVLEDIPMPFYHMWYISALIGWRLAIPYWMRLKYPLLTAVGLSLLASFTDSANQLVQRTLGYFPYFVMGVLLKEHSGNIMALAHRTETKVFAVAMMLLNLVFAVLAADQWLCDEYFERLVGLRTAPCTAGFRRTEPFFLQSPVFHNYWKSVMGLAAAYLVSPPLTLACLALMPDGDYRILRSMGERTLTPYVFHVLPLMPLRAFTSLTDKMDTVHLLPLLAIMSVCTGVLYIPQVEQMLRIIPMFPLDQMGMLKAKET